MTHPRLCPAPPPRPKLVPPEHFPRQTGACDCVCVCGGGRRGDGALNSGEQGGRPSEAQGAVCGSEVQPPGLVRRRRASKRGSVFRRKPSRGAGRGDKGGAGCGHNATGRKCSQPQLRAGGRRAGGGEQPNPARHTPNTQHRHAVVAPPAAGRERVSSGPQAVGRTYRANVQRAVREQGSPCLRPSAMEKSQKGPWGRGLLARYLLCLPFSLPPVIHPP